MPREGNKDFGTAAEEVAVRYIEARGWRVLARNVARKWGEIDIVAQDGAILVCVEVKAGYARDGFVPEDHFDRRKREKVSRACQAYAVSAGLSEAECRVDLASVTVDILGANARVTYYKNAGG